MELECNLALGCCSVYRLSIERSAEEVFMCFRGATLRNVSDLSWNKFTAWTGAQGFGSESQGHRLRERPLGSGALSWGT